MKAIASTASGWSVVSVEKPAANGQTVTEFIFCGPDGPRERGNSEDVARRYLEAMEQCEALHREILRLKNRQRKTALLVAQAG